jgi:hypothetical protein
MPLSSLLAEPEVHLLWWGSPEVNGGLHGTIMEHHLEALAKKWNIIYKWWFKLVYPLVFKKL